MGNEGSYPSRRTNHSIRSRLEIGLGAMPAISITLEKELCCYRKLSDFLTWGICLVTNILKANAHCILGRFDSDIFHYGDEVGSTASANFVGLGSIAPHLHLILGHRLMVGLYGFGHRYLAKRALG